MQSPPQTGSSRRAASPASKTYLHSLPNDLYAKSKTDVLEKLKQERARNRRDGADYTLAEITPVATDLFANSPPYAHCEPDF